jgi:hypothetical protein
MPALAGSTMGVASGNSITVNLLERNMGMRVGRTEAAAGSQGAGAAQWQQRQQGVKDLMSALKSGDLSAAQQAFSGLNGAGARTSGNSPLAQIGQALQSGDLAGAQQAAQAWQAARSGHHHHHGGQVATAAPDAGAATPSGTGTTINLTA